MTIIPSLSTSTPQITTAIAPSTPTSGTPIIKRVGSCPSNLQSIGSTASPLPLPTAVLDKLSGTTPITTIEPAATTTEPVITAAPTATTVPTTAEPASSQKKQTSSEGWLSCFSNCFNSAPPATTEEMAPLAPTQEQLARIPKRMDPAKKSTFFIPLDIKEKIRIAQEQKNGTWKMHFVVNSEQVAKQICDIAAKNEPFNPEQSRRFGIELEPTAPKPPKKQLVSSSYVPKYMELNGKIVGRLRIDQLWEMKLTVCSFSAAEAIKEIVKDNTPN